ncbi:putative bifunctional diguanylate cyclase/phosphodiesterase [Alkalicoccus chagannorensis]|uniref:putative bifunctional diguanylate cyclase/phosphodiesterase n=1 Tax=Alkalicoccus chagannorensis TaxID=427072 RepID=UPI00041C6A1C|nr:bifunctional diguanylate cyclase/phosphodiesterase [Alkalicoccus chagannorensis]
MQSSAHDKVEAVVDGQGLFVHVDYQHNLPAAAPGRDLLSLLLTFFSEKEVEQAGEVLSGTREFWQSRGESGMEACLFKGANSRHPEFAFSMQRHSPDVSEVDIQFVTDPVCAVDHLGRLTYTNFFWERLFLHHGREAEGRFIWEVMHASWENVLKEHVDQKADSRRTCLDQYDGYAESWFHVRVYPTRHGGSMLLFYSNQSAVEAPRGEDALTSLAHRKKIYSTMEELIAKGRPFSCMMLDLKNFREVNNTYTYPVGDLFLIKLAERFQQDMPDVWTGRSGGDEFVFISEGTEDQARMAHRLQTLLEEGIDVEGHWIRAAASLAGAAYPAHGRSPHALFHAMEAAMKEAKTSMADNTYVEYRPQFTENAQRKRTMERDLDTALLDGSYYLVFQPQVDTNQDCIAGVEVLSRWCHPELGHIPPPEFIAAAERKGHLKKITEWIMQEGLSHYLNWRDGYDYDGTMSFNIPPKLLEDDGFLHFLLQLPERWHIKPGKIELELLESTDLMKQPSLHSRLKLLQQHGFKLSVDDFGSGYSKIGYLMEYPFDQVKLDKLFVDRIGRDNKGEAVLRGVVSMVQSIGIPIVVEGVEMERQQHFLEEIGCFVMQGYLFAPPMYAAAVKQSIRTYGRQKKSGQRF